jgi:hypothetical protein
MNLNQKITLITALVFIAASFISCSLPGKEITVGVSAGIAQSRAITPGDPVTAISSYRVIFKKIEIGNSEQDKHTLWQSDVGVIKDIVSDASFDGVLPVPAGSYKFVRLTIEPLLAVDGSIDDNGTVYTGNGTITLDQTAYVWGSVLAGASALSQDISVSEGSQLAFSFDVAGTIAYLSGPASGASLAVAKPTLGVTVK